MKKFIILIILLANNLISSADITKRIVLKNTRTYADDLNDILDRLVAEHDWSTPTAIANSLNELLKFEFLNGLPEVASNVIENFISKIIKEKGINLFVSDDNGNAVNYATENDWIKVVKFLVKENVGILLQNAQGYAPCHIAASNNFIDMTKFLISKSDGYYPPTFDGATPLHIAASKGHKVVAYLLIRKGKIDIDCVDNFGATPLLRAIQNGKELMANFLFGFEYAADVNIADNEGRTPLLWAIMHGKEFSANFLLGRDADVNIADNSGSTPLYWAICNGLDDLVVKLLKRGANRYAKDTLGRTPEEIARSLGNDRVANLIRDWEKIVAAYKWYGEIQAELDRR